MKNNFRKAAATTICMLMVAVMSLTGVTYAWFSAANQATVGQFTMNVDDNAGGIEIATTFGEWKSSVAAPTIAEGTEFIPVSTVKALDSNGALTFYTGTLADNRAFMTTAALTSDQSGYVKFTLFFRNTGSSDVVMDLTGSTIAAVAGENMDIVKATRLGFVDWGNQTITGTAEDTATNFMTPNAAAAIQIYEPEATAHTANGLADGATAGSAHAYKGVKAATSDAIDRKNDTTVLETVETDKALSDVSFTLAAGTYKKIDVYVWVEGQDADCQNDVANEDFNISLQFKKVEQANG